ncbi:unnamed protein product [Caenorhabditis brenneri]
MLIAHRPYRKAILLMIPRSRGIFVEDSRKVVFAISDVHIITGLEIIVVIGYVGYTTFERSPASSVSIKTHQIQKSFFVALLIQTAIPLAMLTFPFVTWLVCILREIYIQWITNLDIFIITLHGTISTFAMLIAHRPYRKAILMMIPGSREVFVEDSRRVYFDQSTV